MSEIDDLLESTAQEAGGSEETSTEETSTEETSTEETSTEETDDRPIWEQYDIESQEAFKERYDTLTASEADYTEKTSQYEQDKNTWLVNEKELREDLQSEKDNQHLYIADDTLAKLSILKNKEDKTDYEFYKSIVLDEPDPKYILGMELAERYPNMTDEDIDQTIEDKYGLDEDEPDEFADDDEKERWNRLNRIKQMDLTDAADKVINGYMEDFDEIELPYNKTLSQEEQILQMVTAKKEWTPLTDDIVKSAGIIKTEIKLGKDDIPLELSLTDDEVKEYSKQVTDYVYNNNISLNNSNKKQVMSMLHDVVLLKKLPQVIEQVSKKSSDYWNDVHSKYWEEKINNPSGNRMRDIDNNQDTSSNKGLLDFEKSLGL